jgi:uncharacterized protein
MKNKINVKSNINEEFSCFSNLMWTRLPSKGIKKNRYVYLIWSAENTNNTLLYAPLSDALFIIGNYEEHLLGEEKWIDSCFNLIPEIENDEHNIIASTFDSTSTHFSIGISERCNLNCIYCHAEASGAMIVNRLEYSELNLICSFIKERSVGQKAVSISFACGGEPTIEWSRFAYVVEKIRSEFTEPDIDLSISMTTNGIYGDIRRKFIVDNFTSVTLSLDGTDTIQNKQRPLLSGKGSFEKVINTAKYFRIHDLPFGLRSTVCRKGLQNMHDFVKYISKHFAPIVVAFEPIVQIGRGMGLKGVAVDPWQFCESFWETYNIGKASGVDVRTSMLNLKQVRATFCGAMAIPSTTFTPEGKITGCHRDIKGIYQYGEIKKKTKEIVINNSKLKAMRKLAIPPYKCEDCFCRWTCGGDCPDIREISDRCNMIRELTFRGLLERVI